MAAAACSPRPRASSISGPEKRRSLRVSMRTSMPTGSSLKRNGTLRHDFSPHSSMERRTSSGRPASEMDSSTIFPAARISRSDG